LNLSATGGQGRVHFRFTVNAPQLILTTSDFGNVCPNINIFLCKLRVLGYLRSFIALKDPRSQRVNVKSRSKESTKAKKSRKMWEDTILIVFISIFTALLGEGTHTFVAVDLLSY